MHDMLFKSILSGMLADPDQLKKFVQIYNKGDLLNKEDIEYIQKLPEPKKNALKEMLKFLSNSTEKVLDILTTPIMIVSDKISAPLEDKNGKLHGLDGKKRTKSKRKKSKRRKSKQKRSKRN